MNKTGFHCPPVEVPALQVQCHGLNLHLPPALTTLRRKGPQQLCPSSLLPVGVPAVLNPGERSLASGAGDFKAQQRVNTGYFVPLTWPLSGMEFGIGGRRVDNGVTTSGKEVQEALVNLDCTHRLASEQSHPHARENAFLSVQGNCSTRNIPKALRHIQPSKSCRLETINSISFSFFFLGGGCNLRQDFSV